jgi:hypothetical protein
MISSSRLPEMYHITTAPAQRITEVKGSIAALGAAAKALSDGSNDSRATAQQLDRG